MILATINGVVVTQDDDKRVHYKAPMAIDADGCNGQSGPSVYAYDLNNKGMELLANAGYPHDPSSYRDILVCRGDKPVVQTDRDLAPGALISMTTYEHRELERENPARYVDAFSVAYMVVPAVVRLKAKGIVIGCRARITFIPTNVVVEAVVADVGGNHRIGEASIAVARYFDFDPSPRTGGHSKPEILYEFWPDSPAFVNGEQYQLQRA